MEGRSASPGARHAPLERGTGHVIGTVRLESARDERGTGYIGAELARDLRRIESDPALSGAVGAAASRGKKAR